MGTKNSWLNPKLMVKNTVAYGMGVFAKEDVKQGERLAIFGGDIMYIDEIKSLPEELRDYTLQIEERFVLGSSRNATEPEDTDFFNHSCEPNSGLKGQIFLVAIRDIQKDEEITFDYAMVLSKSVGSDIVFEMECKCGSKNCRRKITEDDWRIPELQKRYNGYFSQYIQEKINTGLKTKNIGI